MRKIAAATALLLAALATGGSAEARYEGPWCVHTHIGADFIESRCDMRSYEMCRAEMWGLSSSHCSPNPFYKGEPPRRPRKAQPRKRPR